MTELLRVMGDHLSAVERDLIVAGYHLRDIPSKISWAEMIAFVEGSPPGSAVRHAKDDGWSRTDTLLATLIEALTGVAQITGRFKRPGLTDEEVEAQRNMNRQHQAPKDGGRQFLKQPDTMTVSEFEAKYAAQQAQWKAEGV
jgi:hypothetical protein